MQRTLDVNDGTWTGPAVTDHTPYEALIAPDERYQWTAVYELPAAPIEVLNTAIEDDVYGVVDEAVNRWKAWRTLIRHPGPHP